MPVDSVIARATGVDSCARTQISSVEEVRGIQGVGWLLGTKSKVMIYTTPLSRARVLLLLLLLLRSIGATSETSQNATKTYNLLRRKFAARSAVNETYGASSETSEHSVLV